ncbi:hypothetical protein BASA83_007197 [Batrachochytrium salamandrivorans]|nr:hypothetical protein BASA83_007197 [Batrachochytrium salamandrivorans]
MLACRTVSEVLIGIQLAIQTIFIPRGPEFKNTRAQMRLRMIISMFQAASASTSSSDEALEALYLDAANYTASSTRSTHHMLHKESLHHLIPHALWVLEYCAFLVRVLYIRSGAVKTSAVGSNLFNQEVKEFTQIMPFMHQATRRSLIISPENESMQLLHPSTPADHIDMFLGTSIPLSYGPQLTTQLQTLFSGHMTSFFNWPSGVSFPAQLSGATDAATAGADAIGAKPPTKKEFVSVTHFDAVSGQHLRFSLAVRQMSGMCQFSAVDPLSPRALASLMDGSKNTTCVSLIETFQKVLYGLAIFLDVVHVAADGGTFPVDLMCDG